jgi:hypothetical protein
VLLGCPLHLVLADIQTDMQNVEAELFSFAVVNNQPGIYVIMDNRPWYDPVFAAFPDPNRVYTANPGLVGHTVSVVEIEQSRWQVTLTSMVDIVNPRCHLRIKLSRIGRITTEEANKKKAVIRNFAQYPPPRVEIALAGVDPKMDVTGGIRFVYPSQAVYNIIPEFLRKNRKLDSPLVQENVWVTYDSRGYHFTSKCLEFLQQLQEQSI